MNKVDHCSVYYSTVWAFHSFETIATRKAMLSQIGGDECHHLFVVIKASQICLCLVTGQ